ncbi:hypothetical protein ACVU7I_02485 [Patulibacter sp. S7RM1-6]
MRFPTNHRSAGSLALAALIGAAAAMMAPPPASAGDYAVSYCVRPDGTPVGQVPDLDFGTTGRAGTLVAYGCDNAQGSIVLSFDGSQPHSAGEYARATIAASGAGVSIVGASGDGFYSRGLYDVSVGPIAALQGACTQDSPACNQPREWGGQWAAATPEAALNQLTLQVACNQPSCTGGGLTVKHLTITYRDSAPPAAGSAEGSLLTSSPGAPVSGQATVKITAADTGAGVRSGSVLVDGTEVAATAAQCSPPYDRQHACPTRLDKQVLVDTTKIANGTHSVEVTATDASGNTATVSRGTVIVDNGGARGPGIDPNLRGAPIGSYGADDARLQAWWPATARSPSRSRKVQRRCKRSKAYRRRHAVACNGRPASRRIRANFSARKATLVRGRLVTPAGDPVIGARIDVLATPSAAGAAAQPVATLQTDATGRFEHRIPVASGSATYTVAWIALSRDTVASTATTLKRTVKASTTFRARPNRTVKRGRTLTFTGRLRGAAGVRAGNAVAIEANAGSSWRAVRTVRAAADGSWRLRYVVPRQLRGRYRFRAVVAPSAAYPYSVGHSATRTIRVR